MRTKLSYNTTLRIERVSRFLICGGSAAALNVILAYVGVDLLGLNSDLQQNYVNFVAMEVSLVYSFFIYRAFVWKDTTSRVKRILLRQLPLYHLSAGAALLGRTLLFPVLQTLGLHYLLNIVLGILAGAAINYVLSDRYVFKAPVKSPPVEDPIAVVVGSGNDWLNEAGSTDADGSWKETRPSRKAP